MLLDHFCKKRLSQTCNSIICVQAFCTRGSFKNRATTYGQEKFSKSDYFREHSKFHEVFWREYFKILVIKKRVKQLFSRLKKSEEKNL